MKTETQLPPPQGAPEKVKKVRQRHVYSSWVQVIEGVEWTFTLRTDGVHAAAKGFSDQSASYHDVLAVLVKQRTFNLI